MVDGVLAIMMLRAGWKSGWGMVAIAIVQLSQVAFWIDGNEWTWIVVCRSSAAKVDTKLMDGDRSARFQLCTSYALFPRLSRTL